MRAPVHNVSNLSVSYMGPVECVDQDPVYVVYTVEHAPRRFVGWNTKLDTPELLVGCFPLERLFLQDQSGKLDRPRQISAFAAETKH